MILIRCDSSLQIGSGHVYRCLALAELLRDSGENVLFVCKDLPGHYGAVITDAGFNLHMLVDQRDDLASLKELATPGTWLVIDHYQIEETIEISVADYFRLFIIDDLGNRRHSCRILLDPNFHAAPTRYEDLTPEGTVLLLGPRYGLIRQQFVLETQIADKRLSNRVFVFFGGGDPTCESRRFVKALLESQTELQFDLILQGNNPQRTEIEQLIANRPTINLHLSPPKISDLMRACTIYFGSGGTITWERMALGLPGLVVSVADNQTTIAQDLAAADQQIFLGCAGEVDYRAAITMIESFIKDGAWLKKTSEANQSLARRFPASLAKAIFKKPEHDFLLKLAQFEDATFLFELRLDPAMTEMFLSKSEITWESHQRWLSVSLSTPRFRIYIGYLGDQPIGQFRVRPDGDTSVSIVSLQRGHGLASRFIEAASAAYFDEFPLTDRLYAKIKKSNLPSLKSFKKAGYHIVNELDHSDGELIELVCNRTETK